jgi:hypothetical protein
VVPVVEDAETQPALAVPAPQIRVLRVATTELMTTEVPAVVELVKPVVSAVVPALARVATGYHRRLLAPPLLAVAVVAVVGVPTAVFLPAPVSAVRAAALAAAKAARAALEQ